MLVPNQRDSCRSQQLADAKEEPRPRLGTTALEGSEALDQQHKSSWVRRTHSRGLKIWTNYNKQIYNWLLFTVMNNSTESHAAKWLGKQEKETQSKNEVRWSLFSLGFGITHSII